MACNSSNTRQAVAVWQCIVVAWYIDVPKTQFIIQGRSSSVVEQLTADQQVIGSNPMVDFHYMIVSFMDLLLR